MENKKKMVRSNAAQVKHLLHYMSEHTIFASGIFTKAHGNVSIDLQWQRLKEELDEIGPCRSVAQWKICWRDQKLKARSEAGAIRRVREETGNSDVVIPQVSKNTEIVLGTIGPSMAVGTGPQESPIGGNELQPSCSGYGTKPISYITMQPNSKPKRFRHVSPPDKFIKVQEETNRLLKCMARALYDNIAESPDELAFRRGDLLTVLEQNTAGSEGWWLCSLRGRQGICPGNRLRIVAGVFDGTAALQRRRVRTPAPVAHQPMPAQHFTKIEECSHYDVPRAPMPVQRIGAYDSPRPVIGADWYDAPRAPRPASADSACSGTGSLTSATSSISGNSGSSMLSTASASSTYDVPRSRALPLPCDAALEALERLQDEASAAVTRLLSYVTPGWRRRGALRPRVLDVRVAGARLRAALHDLAVFADATLANAADAQDKGIAVKLRPLVKALKDAERITHEATSALDSGDWAPDRLERDREPTDGTQDALDQLVACARSLTEDVRRAASFIQGNASLLFRRSNMPSTAPTHVWTEEYDYVRLESRTAVDRRHAEIRAALPDKLRASFDALVRDADHAGEVSAAAAAARLPPDDRQLATFYAAQTATYGAHLATAVEAFLKTIEMGQPPDVFLAHGKFVVLSAHRIVHVGDTVHRSTSHAGLKSRALRCSDALSDALAATVAKTKAAAQQFPCAHAVTEMALAARTLAARAQELRRVLLRAAEPPHTDTPGTPATPATAVPLSLPHTPLTPLTPHDGSGAPSLATLQIQ